MKKKLLKFTIIFFILIKGEYFVYANEKIILPEKKPDINKAQTSNKIANYLVPIKKPTLKAEKRDYLLSMTKRKVENSAFQTKYSNILDVNAAIELQVSTIKTEKKEVQKTLDDLSAKHKKFVVDHEAIIIRYKMAQSKVEELKKEIRTFLPTKKRLEEECIEAEMRGAHLKSDIKTFQQKLRVTANDHVVHSALQREGLLDGGAPSLRVFSFQDATAEIVRLK